MLAIPERITAAVMLIVFTLGQVSAGQAQGLTLLPAGERVSLSAAYAPCLMKGVRYYPDDPFRFDFIVEPGDSGFAGDRLQEESSRLIKQFLASLTTPAYDLWVNLSPYESGKIIPDSFGLTEMGRDLLAQDYVLKQMTASLMDPDSAMGKEFWRKVYARAMEDLGDTDIPVDTFHKIWIVPSAADIVVKNNTAVVVKSHLKVMLERDYYAQQSADFEKVSIDEEEAVITDTMRAVILPEVEREINEGQNFAPLRQIYNSLVLAVWMKRKVKSAVLAAYADRNKIVGVEHGEPGVAGKVWERYAEAFRAGVAHSVREERDLYSGEIIPRKYFSGGFDLAQIGAVQQETILDAAETLSVDKAQGNLSKEAVVVSTELVTQQGATLPPGDSAQSASIAAEAEKLEDKVNPEIVFKMEPGKSPTLQVSGVTVIPFVDGQENFVFRVGDKVIRISKKERLIQYADRDYKFVERVRALQIAEKEGLGPHIREYGITSDKRFFYVIQDWWEGVTLDKLDQNKINFLWEANNPLIEDFIQKLFDKGVYLEDFNLENLFLTTGKDEKLYIGIVDGEHLKYSFSNPQGLTGDLKRVLRNSAEWWPKEKLKVFQTAIANVSARFEKTESFKNDYWGHRAAERQDSAQMSRLENEAQRLAERKNNDLVFLKDGGQISLKYQNAKITSVDNSGGLNFIFFSDSRVFRISKDVRKENDINSDRMFLETIRSFEIAEKESMGPKLHNYGLTADGKHYYMEVDRWRGPSLDAVDEEQKTTILNNDGILIKAFLQKLFDKGLYLLDFTPGNLLLYTHENGEQELLIVDPEFVKYSYGYLPSFKRELNLRLERARDEWDQDMYRAFQKNIERVYADLGNKDFQKNDYWGHRAAEVLRGDRVEELSDKAQGRSVEISTVDVIDRVNAEAVFSEEGNSVSLTYQGTKGTLLGQGQHNYVFSVGTKAVRVGITTRENNIEEKDRVFAKTVQGFQIASEVKLGPAVLDYGLTADGKRHYMEVDLFKGASLDKVNENQIASLLKEDRAVIRGFIQELMRTGVWMSDMNPMNIFLSEGAEGVLELMISDAENVQYAYDNPFQRLVAMEEAINSGWKLWLPELRNAFLSVIQESILEVDDLNNKADYWGHAKREEQAAQDRAQGQSDTARSDNLGGIDLDDKNLAINETGDGVLQPVIGAGALAQLGDAFIGFLPVILAIKPLGDMGTFAGK